MDSNYESLLLRDEWKAKRIKILKRDNFRCARCGRGPAYEGYDREGNLLGYFGTGDSITSRDIVSLEIISFEEVKKRIGHDDLAVTSIKYHPKRFFASRNGFAQVFSTVDFNYDVLESSLEYAQAELRNGKSVFLEKMRQESFRKLKKPIVAIRSYDDISFLNVHHKVYREGCYPWDYPDDDLVSLCEECHEKLHDSGEVVDVERLTPCYRCGGKGYFPQFKHVEDGICFRCRGAKFEEHIK